MRTLKIIITGAILALLPACTSYRTQKELLARAPQAADIDWQQSAAPRQAAAPAIPERMERVEKADARTTPFINQAALSPNREIDRLTGLILANNPAIKAATNKVAATKSTYGQERAINDLLASYQAFTAASPAIGPKKMGLSNIALHGPASLRSRLVSLEVKKAALAREKTIAKTITRGRTLYYRLVHLKTTREITAQSLALFTNLEQVALARYNSGESPYQDVVTIQIKKEKLSTRLRDLEEEEKSVLRDLAELTAAPLDQITFTAESSPAIKLPEAERIINLAAAGNLDLLLARNRKDILATMLELARTMAVPDFSNGLSRRMGSDIAGTFVSAKMTAPGRPADSFKGAGLYYLERIRLESEAAGKAEEEARRRSQAKGRRAWEAVDKSRRQAALLAEKIVPLSRSALDVARQGFEAGRTAFAGLIKAHDQWLNDRIALSAAQTAAETALARLWQTLGRDLATTNKNPPRNAP